MKPALIIVEGKMRPYERHQAIFLLQSPVYDSNFTKQDHIIYEWSTQIDGGPMEMNRYFIQKVQIIYFGLIGI